MRLAYNISVVNDRVRCYRVRNVLCVYRSTRTLTAAPAPVLGKFGTFSVNKLKFQKFVYRPEERDAPLENSYFGHF